MAWESGDGSETSGTDGAVSEEPGADSASASSTEIPKASASPTRPVGYPCPTARNFQPSPRRYSSPQMTAVSSPVSARTSNTASGSPSADAASYSDIRRSVTRSNAASSQDAAMTTCSTEGSSEDRSASIVSVSPSGELRLGRRRTRPDGCRGWL